MTLTTRLSFLAALLAFTLAIHSAAAEDWPQLLGNGLRSGDAGNSHDAPARLVGAIPLSDAILASPVVFDGRVFVIDGAGVVFAIDQQTLEVVWKYATRGGAGNCNNVAAPAIIGGYVHVGTMAGDYYVLDRDSGAVINEIHCGEPIFAAPAVGKDRVYFATLGRQDACSAAQRPIDLDVGLCAAGHRL